MPESSEAHDVLLNQLADQFVVRHRSGERPRVEEYCDRHPTLASDIRSLFPALAELERAKADAGPKPAIPGTLPSPPTRLGDFRLLREVGRGGMGVVYEAEQVSLGRRVALKVLVGGKAGDGLERFRREARAAGRLHHTNIVPVFGVGDHEGTQYYIMQFIQGLGLDEVLKDVKCLQATGGAAVIPSEFSTRPPRVDISAPAVARSLLTGTFERSSKDDPDETRTQAPGTDGPVFHPRQYSGQVGNLSQVSNPSVSLPGQTTLAGRKLTYWQSVARIGLQVADALDYAHKQGVLHRDIKPSNLLLDLHGVVWITDFGLAKADDQADLTNTGDLLGTLRYMPPEAFEGKFDARSDVYALGLTLYEMLALRPAFTERSREQLIKRVTTTDPSQLGSVNKAIPRDLQTIIHKAIEKDSLHRYRTAGELAADLRRFVDDRPILARSIGSFERGWRWCRRNPLVANLAVAVAVLLVAGTTVATYFAIHATRARDQADARAKEAEENARQTLLEKDRADRKAVEAENNAVEARDNLYVVRLNSIQMALDNANLPLAETFLEQLRNSASQQKRPLGWEWRYFWRLCHDELRSLRGHTDDVCGVAFSPDGTRLASGSDDGSLRLWETATGRQLFSFPVKSPWKTCIAFSPDGTRLAVSTDGNTASVLDAASGRVLQRCQGHTQVVRGLTFSPDGARLFTVGEDRTLRFWDVASGRELCSFPHPAGYLRCVAVSPDGRWLALGGSDAMLMIRDAVTGQEVRSFFGHTGGARGVAFSPDGRRLVTAGQDRIVKVWDPATGRELLTLAGHTGELRCVCFHPDGTRLASAGHDRMVKVWDSNTGEEVESLLGHTDRVYALAFSPDGQCLASAGADMTIRLTHPDKRPRPRILKGHVNQVRAVGFSVDGQRLVSVGQDGRIVVWDTVTGREQKTFPVTPTGHLGMAISPDARHLATSGDYGAVAVWDLTTGRRVWKMKGHPSWLSALAFSPDGRWLVSGGAGDRVNAKEPIAIKLWEVATGREVRAFLGHTDEVRSLVFTRDGTQLISASNDGTIRVWDLATGSEHRILRGNESGVNCIALHRDGKLLASCSNRSVKLWNLANGQSVRTFQGHFDTVWSVAFHPDGSRLASASFDRTVRVWDTASGLELAILKGHPDRVLGVAFSPNGNLLATAGGTDQTVRLWDARPLSHDVNEEIEAAGLLEYLFARPLPRSEVLAAVKRDKTICEATRRKALEFADRYKEETDPKKYLAAAWPVVRHPYSNAFLREFALGQAKAACRLEPDNHGFLGTLGVAQYRLGLDQEALATLLQSDRLASAASKGKSSPTTLTFLAMTLHRLNQKDEARAALARLRDIVKAPEWAGNEEAQAFWQEAEGLIEGEK